MNKEIKSVLKKTAKIAGVTCVAAGGIAIMSSGVALRAISEGGRYLVNTFRKIAKGKEKPDIPAEVSEKESE